jgi:hypothetical protein
VERVAAGFVQLGNLLLQVFKVTVGEPLLGRVDLLGWVVVQEVEIVLVCIREDSLEGAH